jgi:tetratricopeptide (TPR) repeat protein
VRTLVAFRAIAGRFLLPVLFSAVLAALPHPLLADLWYEHYAAAERALEEEEWTEAIDQINRALERKGDPGARVRTYGMKFTAYFPYLKLGIAYYHLKQLDAALQAFETEEQLGAIAGSNRDLQELERYRTLANEAKQKEENTQAERIIRIAAENLEESYRLEQEGRLEEAVTALGKVLAVAPDHAEAPAVLERLRTKIAQRQEEEDLEQRVATLVEGGESFIAQGLFSEASSVLRQALSLSESEKTRELLEEAQEKLRAELRTDEEEERTGLIARKLAEASDLQAGGRLGDALDRLQSVLALDPTHPDALALQKSLLDAQAEADRDRLRRDTVDGLLADAESALATSRFEDALSTANQVLALDAGNATALDQLARAYRAVNRRLLGGSPRQNFPPAIRFVDLREERDDGTLAQLVRSPEFHLSGVVIDDSPVEITFLDSENRAIEGSLSNQSLGDLYITEFHLAHTLTTGLTSLRLVATDSELLTSSSEYTVQYVRPLLRSPSLYGSLAALLILAAGVVWRGRVRRRKRLHERRFNPYMAGAPVLDSKLFFGRQLLLDRVLQTLHNNSLLLYGERRIGKTSLQHQLKRRLNELQDPDYDFYPVYVDLQGTPEERFFATLAEEIFQELGPVLDGLKPNAPTSEGYSYHDLVKDLRTVLKALRLHSEKQVRLVLLIDEVDELNSYDPRVNQKLRSLFMKSFAENLVAVVSGVSIKRDWEREGSPWYNFFEEIDVGPLRPKDARELIEQPIQGVFKLEDGVTDKILALTERRPFRIQKFCMRLVNRMYEVGRRRITLADVEALGPPAEGEPS